MYMCSVYVIALVNIVVFVTFLLIFSYEVSLVWVFRENYSI